MKTLHKPIPGAAFESLAYLRNTFGPCPHCGELVLLRVIGLKGGVWQECVPPRSSVLGYPHVCPNPPADETAESNGP